ncbi:hypothetical protein EQ832_11880 [Pseudomonas sp. ALS1131]|nr:hypothetical protein [Pseudomonas sp. ALS1131]TRO38549.1 hypothetical protein EQ832_11880 [Pseudomonas sp. ALS1131]
MTAWLKLVPSWGWALLAGLALAGAQQIRVISLQDDLVTARKELVDESGKLGACRATRTNLLEQIIEQNGALAEIRSQGQARADTAAAAQADAQQHSQADYQAANRLQQERTGGDACAAAESVIDGELGL